MRFLALLTCTLAVACSPDPSSAERRLLRSAPAPPAAPPRVLYNVPARPASSKPSPFDAYQAHLRSTAVASPACPAGQLLVTHEHDPTDVPVVVTAIAGTRRVGRWLLPASDRAAVLRLCASPAWAWGHLHGDR